MKVAVLFSGGKDSTFSIYKAKLDGHKVECVVTIFPQSYESKLLHYPNIQFTKLQSESMNIFGRDFFSLSHYLPEIR